MNYIFLYYVKYALFWKIPKLEAKYHNKIIFLQRGVLYEIDETG
jgi:hypothetical protein